MQHKWLISSALALAIAGCSNPTITKAPSVQVNQVVKADISLLAQVTEATSGSSSMAVKDGFAYVIYTDKADYLGKLAKIEIATGKIERSEQTFFTIGNGDRSHNDSAMAIDGNGFVHVWIGMHNHQMRYYRSTKPNSIENFDNLSNKATFRSYDESYNDWAYVPTPEDNDKTYYSHIKRDLNKNGDIRLYSYPHAVSLPNGDVALTLRRAGIKLVGPQNSIRDINTDEKQDFYYFDHKTQQWTEYELLQQSGKNAYMAKLYADANSNVHMVTAWSQLHRGGNTFQRGTYVKFDSKNKSFHKADGTKVSLPIAVDSIDADNFYPWSGEWLDKRSEIQTPQVTVDSDGHPVVVYPYNTNDYSRDKPLWELRTARWDGSKWINSHGLGTLKKYNRPPITQRDGKLAIYTADRDGVLTMYESFDDGKQFVKSQWGAARYPTTAIKVDAKTDLFINLHQVYKVTHQ